MTTPDNEDRGPDLSQGITLSDFGTRHMVRGHVGDEDILLARVNGEFFAVGAFCTHYGGALVQGRIEGETVRCPMHHACFSLRSGEAVAAPAFDALSCWQVERSEDRLYVCTRLDPAPLPAAATDASSPQRIVIIGGGAAGFAAAEMLRRRGWTGELDLLSADGDAPCDRPNLSKDYLAGSAPEEWIPLRDSEFYAANRINLQLDTSASRIDVAARTVITADGRNFPYDRLLIATGAEPVHLPIPGTDLPHVFTLRSLADSRAIIARAEQARSAVVLGSGFIGLEVAAALRSRGLDVHIVSLDQRPLERVLGPELGDFIRSVHESQGEIFHMGRSIGRIEADHVVLDDDSRLDAELVVLGIGVRPRLQLAAEAGLATDHGVLVNAQLQTSVAEIYAAGDIASWPGAADGSRIRVEHWVVAERQGQVAAENMLGAGKAFNDPPFFWSVHHDVSIRYVGHAVDWDEILIDGSIEARDCMVSYRKNGQTVAVATIGRDQAALEQSARMTGQG